MKQHYPTLLVTLLLLASPASHAHKRWFMPTDFTLSEAETVTVDFTASNNVFFVDSPMPLASVEVISPSGVKLPLEQPYEGKRRSSFDIPVAAAGTYRVTTAGPPMYFVSYLLPGETKPQGGRGKLEQLKAKVPMEATDVTFSEAKARIETFVTLGGQTPLQVDEKADGLQINFGNSHPNALYTDEPANFAFLLNGEPIAGLDIAVTADGSRYRDDQEDRSYTTGEDGSVAIDWPQPGRYLLEASTAEPLANGEISTRYYSYFLTVEVMAP